MGSDICVMDLGLRLVVVYLAVQAMEELQRMHAMNNNYQRAAKAMNKSCGTPLVPFAMLYPFIEPQLDKDRAMQLRGLYAGFRNRRISKVEFVRRVRTIVGDHMIKMAVYKFQTTRAD
ncbi:Histone-fold [Artemisia annua]|uniref:Histone-fold n=1 Tax=Artemisia annua TaxID=35608 RepID=A0A2U1MC06_ARTAN|nr:Histone-fold [Artemisia annua]